MESLDRGVVRELVARRAAWRTAVRWLLLGSAGVALVGALSAQAAHAQAGWPGKQIRLVSPFPPGGTTDQLARLVAPGLAQALGTQVIVENKPGGNGSIGTGYVAKMPPDGSAFVFVFDTHGTNPSLIPNMSFDTRKDLAPVMLVATGAMVLVGHKSQPYRNFQDFIDASRNSAGGLSYGSVGTGSLAHLTMTSLGAQMKFPVVHVPYKGGGPLTQDAIAGHVPVSMATTALFSTHIRSGALVPLAVTSAKRDPALPDVPTIAEQGLPGFEALAWWGVFAPAGTSAQIIDKVNQELARILSEPKIRDRLTSLGMNLTLSKPDELGSFTDTQLTRWAKVIKEHNIRAGD